MEPYTFQPEIKKLKTIHPRKFLILQETKTSKKILIFQEIELSFVSGKEYLEPWHKGTILMLQERNIQNPYISLIFQEKLSKLKI